MASVKTLKQKYYVDSQNNTRPIFHRLRQSIWQGAAQGVISTAREAIIIVQRC